MAKILDKPEHVQVLHQHKYARLNDSQIFCACGEVMTVAAQVAPACCHGYHCYHWPYTVQFYPAWQPTWTTPTTWTASSSDTDTTTRFTVYQAT